MHLLSVVPAVMCKSHRLRRTLSDTLHIMDYYEIRREQTRIQIETTLHSMYGFIPNTSIYFPHDIIILYIIIDIRNMAESAII